MLTLDPKHIAILVAYAVLTAVLNLIFSKRSQIDEWCEANPRLAAFAKFLRGVGVDPWTLAQSLVLMFTSKLPGYQKQSLLDLKSKPNDPKLPPRFPGALVLLLGCGLALHAQACSSAPPKPPCDPTTLTAITAECSVQAFECGRQGIPKAECPAIAECNARLDARAGECRK